MDLTFIPKTALPQAFCTTRIEDAGRVEYVTCTCGWNTGGWFLHENAIMAADAHLRGVPGWT